MWMNSVKRRGLAVVAGALVLSVPFGVHAASAADPEPPTSCEPSALRLPDGFDQAIGSAVSPDGRYVGGRVYADNRAQPALWSEGEPQPIQVPGADAQVREVNNAGVMVGVSASDGQWANTPWVYRDGEGSVLPGVAGAGDARAVNENGDIAGVREVEVPSEPPNPPGIHSFPVRWDGETGKAERLSVPNGSTDIYVGGITEDGTVVGIDRTRPTARVYAWPKDGERYELTAPDGEPRPESITAGGSMVVADAETADGYVTVLWDLAEPADPVVVTKRIQYVDSVNEHGWVVGTGTDSAAVFASVEGGDVVLPPLANQSSANAAGITGDGRTVVGSGSGAGGANAAVVWDCS